MATARKKKIHPLTRVDPEPPTLRLTLGAVPRNKYDEPVRPTAAMWAVVEWWREAGDGGRTAPGAWRITDLFAARPDLARLRREREFPHAWGAAVNYDFANARRCLADFAVPAAPQTRPPDVGIVYRHVTLVYLRGQQLDELLREWAATNECVPGTVGGRFASEILSSDPNA